MTDTREMLEMAAKAMGLKGEWNEDEQAFIPISDEGFEDYGWNPTEEGGDCEEMEAALQINLRWLDGGVEAIQSHNPANTWIAIVSNHSNDRAAARRWASTRVAEAIGRAMK